jgi:hypothetical protein
MRPRSLRPSRNAGDATGFRIHPSIAFLWGFNFLHPMLYEQGLGKFRTGVIVSRQMNPKSG